MFPNQAITCFFVAVGLALVAYFVVLEIQEWLSKRKEQEDKHQKSVNEYIQGLQQKIANLEEDYRAAMFRELGYLDERKITNARLSFMSRELSFDDMNKQTQVLQR